MRLLLFIFLLSPFFAFSQKVALYYFDKGLQEFTGKYPELLVEGEKGELVDEVVEKFGKEKRKVYQFPQKSGLTFDNVKAKDFIRGSYAIEMYFKYDNGNLLIYNQMMGGDVNTLQGKYVHLVSTRDQNSKMVNVFLNGKRTLQFQDPQNQMEVDETSQITFFANGETLTTSGTIAMIKLYNFFIDEQAAITLFKAFSENSSPEKNLIEGVLSNLFFVQSQAVILPESIPTLENIYEFMVNNPKAEIELKGHTDNQGDFNLNIKLSLERSKAVKDFLVSKGIKPTRIKTKGVGSTKPIASNQQEETRRKNRRVELKIIKN